MDNEYEDTMVDEEEFDADEEVELPDDIEEVEDDDSDDIDSLDEEEEDAEEEDAPEPEVQTANEPGYVKRRVDKAVAKAVAETEARMQAMFEQQMAPFRAKMMEDEAQELVRTRKVNDIETARELVRFRQGQTAMQQQAPPQPRNDQGQFAPRMDVAVEAKIDMLAHQADTIKDETGVDVIEVFANDPEIKQAVMDGEIDFYDLAKMMTPEETKRPPSPMRSPNGASGVQGNSITNMSDEQFRRFEKRISEGARYTLR